MKTAASVLAFFVVVSGIVCLVAPSSGLASSFSHLQDHSSFCLALAIGSFGLVLFLSIIWGSWLFARPVPPRMDSLPYRPPRS